MRKQNKLFFIIVSVEAHTADKAMRGWKEGEVVGLLHRTQEVRELAQSIGFETTTKEWSDYENIPPEMGFRSGKKAKRAIPRP